MTIPYCYLLRCKPINMVYYGSKWANNCHPDTFWIDYFTSSDLITLLRTIFGDDAFEFEIRKTFKTGKKCSQWEEKVLKKMKVLQNQHIWLNRTNNTAWLYNEHPNKGKIWITNGVDDKFISLKEQVPIGYKNGKTNHR